MAKLENRCAMRIIKIELFLFAKMNSRNIKLIRSAGIRKLSYFYVMKKQNYKNHVQFHVPHHFMLLPLLAIAIVVSVYHIFHSPFQQVLYIWVTILLLFMIWIVIMLRQHYALGNQNRIVRLEMRLRYYQLTGNRFEPVEKQLYFNQIAALRFASDDELLPLIDRAIKEKLSPKDIKQSIVNWQADYMRV